MESFKIECGDRKFDVFPSLSKDGSSVIYEVLVDGHKVIVSSDDKGKLVANNSTYVDPELTSLIINRVESHYL